jgi:hypothetical protein
MTRKRRTNAVDDFLLLQVWGAIITRLIMGGPLTAELIRAEIAYVGYMFRAYQRHRMAHALRALLAKRADTPPALCEHDVWQWGACKNTDCPNCIDNLMPDPGPLAPPEYRPGGML